ncbi:MAG TPA: family 16 glycosylhydrolase [Sporichthyaceae bacterium]|nr:family 16 glycosylhydrolase [Sporichthyaceae bacterium]
MRRKWLGGLVGVAVVGGAALAAVPGPAPELRLTTAAASHPAAATAWRTVWQEDFTGPAGTLPSASDWKFDLGRGYPDGPSGWGNHELEQYTADPSNVSLDGAGDLRITPTLVDGVWHSGRIETQRSDFAPPPGGSLKIEARIQLPGGGKGYWPAFWALGNTFRTHEQVWPHTGELDLMENVNNSPVVHGTLHCGQAPGGACDEPHGMSAEADLGQPAGSAGWHTYTLIWNAAPQQLIWQVDGRTYASATSDQVSAQALRGALSHGYFLLFNVAVGGTWPGSPDATTKPGASMLVDWVRVSQTSRTSD